MDIDFVIPWVDGSDVKWLTKKNQYLDNPEPSIDSSINRYRDWGLLKYWFRGVHKFAPWVRKIYFVTDDQCPDWLNTKADKLCLIDHKDYIPHEYLPTFSANPIELNVHRIKGLSEHFVFFNDDIFITSPVAEADFFRNGLPCGLAVESPIAPDKDDVFNHILLNDCAMLNHNYSRREFMRTQRSKRYSLVDGRGFLMNLALSLFRRDSFFGFDYSHLASSFLKSNCEKVWADNGEWLNRVCNNKFRSVDDVNQYIFTYYQYVEGKFTPYNWHKLGYCFHYDSTDDNQCRDLCDMILNGRYKILCVNDVKVDNFEEVRNKVVDAFDSLLPEKSPFEL